MSAAAPRTFMKLTRAGQRAQRQAAERRAAVLAFLAAKAYAYANGASYDDTCFRAADVATAARITGLEADDILVALRDEGFAEYHRPHDAPAYWRATGKARSAARPT